jgi:hypothetical protein
MSNLLVTSVLITLCTIVNGEGVVITQSPIGTVTRGSSQSISWSVPNNVTLQMAAVDLYRSGNLRSHLGMSVSNTRTFLWHVSNTAPYGDGYYIKVIATSNTGKVAWANSQSFSIGSSNNFSSGDVISTVIAVILVISLCWCCWKRQQNPNYFGSPHPSNRYNPMGDTLPTTYPSAPVAIPTAGTASQSYPVVVNPAVPPRSGYSGATVAGAAVAGAIGGALFEESMCHHSGWGGSSNFGGGGDNFGGGSFGGDNAGDSGGAF